MTECQQAIRSLDGFSTLTAAPYLDARITGVTLKPVEGLIIRAGASLQARLSHL
jgi:hypothetical protein